MSICVSVFAYRRALTSYNVPIACVFDSQQPPRHSDTVNCHRVHIDMITGMHSSSVARYCGSCAYCRFADPKYYMNALTRPLAPHIPHRSTHNMLCGMFPCLLHHLVKWCVQEGLDIASITTKTKEARWRLTYQHAAVLQEAVKRQEIAHDQFSAHKDTAMDVAN